MKKKISLREIASKAKVSTATPSIVLNEKKNQGISKKTWKKEKKINVFFTYDEIAMSAYQALKEDKLNFPQDISIIGFDNSNLSLLVKPKLTTVQLPYSEMTQKAIQHIIDPQKFDDNFNILVESPLIKRESVKVKK